MELDNIKIELIEENLEIKNKFYIEIYDELESTNKFLAELSNIRQHGHVVIAKKQTNGVGRFQREFFSPKDTGVYMSILIKPSCDINLKHITVIGALAGAKAIEEVSLKPVQIKWVNDLLIEGKKIGGILTQADFKNGEIRSIVLGIGVNVYKPYNKFPQNIQNTAGYVLSKHKKDTKSKYIAKFLDYFFEYYDKMELKNYINEYKQRSCLIDKIIKYKDKNAKVIGINNDCNLIIEYENGQKEELIAGEVSLKEEV